MTSAAARAPPHSCPPAYYDHMKREERDREGWEGVKEREWGRDEWREGGMEDALKRSPWREVEFEKERKSTIEPWQQKCEPGTHEADRASSRRGKRGAFA